MSDDAASLVVVADVDSPATSSCTAEEGGDDALAPLGDSTDPAVDEPFAGGAQDEVGDTGSTVAACFEVESATDSIASRTT